MASFVPWIRDSQVAELPPGGEIHDSRRELGGELTVLYVGNVSEYYRMHELFTAVTSTEGVRLIFCTPAEAWEAVGRRSEEHTSELQSRGHLVCRLLLEKKNMSTWSTRLLA